MYMTVSVYSLFSSFTYCSCSFTFSRSLRSLSTVPFFIFSSSLSREFFCFSKLRLDFNSLLNLSYAVVNEQFNNVNILVKQLSSSKTVLPLHTWAFLPEHSGHCLILYTDILSYEHLVKLVTFSNLIGQ